jgi:hypothetical protein
MMIFKKLANFLAYYPKVFTAVFAFVIVYYEMWRIYSVHWFNYVFSAFRTVNRKETRPKFFAQSTAVFFGLVFSVELNDFVYGFIFVTLFR